MSLHGRTALVTGGGRGIGRAISLGLARDGADVAVNYRRDKDAADEVVREIEGMGRRAMAVQAAVDQFEDDERMVAEVEGTLGPIGILVNNAGISSRGNAVVHTGPDEVLRVFGVHAFGVHRLCSLVLPRMREMRRGDIVMISSSATRLLPTCSAPYTMAKAAVEALAAILSKEERSHGIRVNVVAPGLIDTEMGRKLVRASMGVEEIHELDEAAPFGRVGTPGDVAAAVRFLVTAENVTNQRLYVDGDTEHAYTPEP